MALLRLAVLAAAGYGLYKYATRPRPISAGTQAHDGLVAIYQTREQADLAVEHLVQEYGVNRATIFVGPVNRENTSGVEISGGDAPSGDRGTHVRQDAPLNGTIRVTVAATNHELAMLRHALEDAGAVEVQPF